MTTSQRAVRAIGIQDLARHLDAEVDPAAALQIHGVRAVEDAGPADLTFLANPVYARCLPGTRAGAILVLPDTEVPEGVIALRTTNPYLAFARALELFHRPSRPPSGRHPTAVVPASSRVAEGVHLGAYVVLGEDVVVEEGAVLHAHAVVYAGAHIGAGTVVHSHAVIREGVRLGRNVIVQNGAVLGGDGFGFAPRGDGSWHKIPQTGGLEVGDDVEIQAGACVDRAAVGTTRIGRGSKLDNLVQVGHGCTVGEDTLLCGQVGLAGSTHVGDRVKLAGQVGIAGHCRIGDDVEVGAQSGVSGDLEPGGVFGGTPAVDFRLTRKQYVLAPRLPELFRRLKALERRVAQDEAPSP